MYEFYFKHRGGAGGGERQLDSQKGKGQLGVEGEAGDKAASAG